MISHRGRIQTVLADLWKQDAMCFGADNAVTSRSTGRSPMESRIPMMQTRLLFLLLILALLAASAQAQNRNATLIISGGTLIDGTGAPPVPDAAVVVTGNRIADAGP